MYLLSEKSLTNQQIIAFIIFAVLVNALGLLSPILASNDANFYAIVAKNIVLSNDWVNLTFSGKDWLDKPHFPFWMTALSYKCFGVSTFSYILPGFIFSIVGGYYTFLLAQYLFDSKKIGLLSALIYFTSLHLMLSSIDVRQEAYLLGEIMPACYYWLRYDESSKVSSKYLIYGAIFTALALMTKGLFTLITIFSGIVVVYLFKCKWRSLFSTKWLLAILLSFLFIIPELLMLYLQFDINQSKVVFGQEGVSGIKWFFWGSQFGRFFGIGPIVSGKHDSIAHYFYFFHTILWSFLPWSLAIFFIIANFIKLYLRPKELSENLVQQNVRLKYVYLFATIIPTFILFSLTEFQLDHYTNIILPFLAILCAEFLFNTTIKKRTRHLLFSLQLAVSYLICGLIIILSLIIFTDGLLVTFIILDVLVILLFLILVNNYLFTKAIIYSVVSICLVFFFTQVVNGRLYAQYDVGYQVNKYITGLSGKYSIIDYRLNSLSLEFFSKYGYKRIDSVENLLINGSQPGYLLVDESESGIVNNKSRAHLILLNRFAYIKQNKFIPTLFNRDKRVKNTSNVLLYKIN